jgi:bifunctional DNase/RNase
MEIEVKIRGLMMDPSSGTPIIILKDVNSETMLPIWVGAYEANAIALEIEKIAPQRPMTHDLLRNLIVEMGARVERVVVTELKDNTFFAVIEMHDSSGEKLIIRASRNTMGGAEEEEASTGSEEEWPDIIGEAGDLPM